MRQAGPSLVCVLPRGAAAEQTFEIADLALELRVNRPPLSDLLIRPGTAGTRPATSWWNPRDYRCRLWRQWRRWEDMPEREAGRTIPVTLDAKLTELGLLQVSCRSAAVDIRQSWPLEFNLRPHEQAERGSADVFQATAAARPNVEPSVLDAASPAFEPFSLSL